jgi:hypothetical protein
VVPAWVAEEPVPEVAWVRVVEVQEVVRVVVSVLEEVWVAEEPVPEVAQGAGLELEQA